MEYYSKVFHKFPKMRLERDFSFRRHTTIGCGGIASACAYPQSAVAAAKLLEYLRLEKIPYIFLGAGANVLPREGVFEGVVVRFSCLNKLFLKDRDILFSGAGVTGGALCRFARENAFSGFEPFTGIPMTVGGGIVMNAGVAEGHLADVVERVVGIENGKIRSFTVKECAFSEKESVFQSGIAVIGAVLRGTRKNPAEIEERTAYFREKRKNLPKGRSMGCCFVNPPGVSAGKLIDECGLKGISCGGAYVSPEHANFILNEGDSADDVLRLLSIVKDQVKIKTGILLKEEIRRLP